MDAKKKKRINRLQNASIIVLSVFALCLFFYTFAPTADTKWEKLANIFSSHAQSTSFGTEQSVSALSAPLQIAVTGQHGRFGCTATLSDEALFPLNILLKEAFGSAGNAASTTEEAFRAALLQSGVYYDFSVSLPTHLLSSMLDTDLSAIPTDAVRRLLLSVDGDTVRLFSFDGAEYHVSATAISPVTLESSIALFEPNDTAFLFERSDTGHTLDPFTLITEDMLSRPEYLCTTPSAAGESDRLLEYLGFNSHSNSRYVESDGTEVIFGSDATIRIETDGTVTYTGPRHSDAVFQAEGTDSASAIAAAYRIASGLLSSSAGDAALYFAGLEETKDGYTVSFDYTLNGTPIRFRDGSSAASVTLSDGVITAFSLHCRSYTLSDTALRPLPLTQALAIASDKQGTLGISYVDNGTNSLSISWIVMQ